MATAWADGEPAPPKPARSILTVTTPFAAGLLTLAAYLSWLGWHDVDYYYDQASGRQQGPYHPWQVVGLGSTLALLALAGGFLRRPGSTAAVMTFGLVVVWSLDHSYTPTPGANLWPVGAIFLAVGSALGLSVAAYIGLGLRRVADRIHRRTA